VRDPARPKGYSVIQIVAGLDPDIITANIAKIGHFHVADVPGRHQPAEAVNKWRCRLASMSWPAYATIVV